MADSSGSFSKDNQLVLDGTTSIQDLHSPAAFAATILQEIDEAQDLVILSALYLGTGSQESQIVERAEAALKDTANRPNFKIKFFFDHSRGQRGSINSVTLLTELVKNYHPRAQVYLYQMPQLRGFVDYLPFQLKELLGVYHCKFSVFDKKAILTGANLSEDYFTNRQDRYFLIGPQDFTASKDQSDDCAEFTAHSPSTPSNLKHTTLANYLTSFADIVSKESHELLPNGTLQAPVSVRNGTASTMGTDLLDLVKQRRNADIRSNNPGQSNSHIDCTPHSTKQSPMNNEANSGDRSRQHPLPAPTCIYPLIQHSPLLHIHQESTALSRLLTQPFVSLHNALLCIATPYTNFRSTFLRTLLSPLQNHCSVELCVPSVPAHGFGSATGIKGFIPLLHFYSLQVEAVQYIKSFAKINYASHNDNFADTEALDDAAASDASSAADVYHTFYYMRPEWTYHTKGIWLFPSSMTESSVSSEDKEMKPTSGKSTSKGNNATMLTYLGSSNFGERSWSRDFELGFVFATAEAPLQQLFKNEYVNMRQHCGMDNMSGVSVNGVQVRVTKNVRGIGGPVKNIPVVPTGLLPQHNSVQKWLLYSIARIIRSFL